MAEQFYTLLTEIGKAKIANATALGTKINLKTLKVGDSNGNYYNPTEAQEKLINEVWSGTINSVTVDPSNSNWVVIAVPIPSDVGGFTIREIGIEDDAGDLIAIGKYPETYKPVIADGSTKDLIIRIIFEVSNSDGITLKIDPTVILATRKDIEDLAGNGRTTETVKGISDKLDSHLADYVRQPAYAVATGTVNTYAVSTTPAPASYVDGMGIAVKINVASTGASTLNWNGLGAKNLVDSNGNAITNFKANVIYPFKYENVSGNFILQSKGGGGNATASQLLTGATATVDSGQIVGTMPENGVLDYTPTTSPQTIPIGHTTGGTVAGVAVTPSQIVAGNTICGVAGTGKRMAVGSGTTYAYDYKTTITGLSFQPSTIIIWWTDGYSTQCYVQIYTSALDVSSAKTADNYTPNKIYLKFNPTDNFASKSSIDNTTTVDNPIVNKNAAITPTSDGFILQGCYGNVPYHFVAYE